MQPQNITKRKVTTDSLNVRAQPSTSAAIVGQYKQGDIVEVVAAGAVQADNHNWQQTADGRGWVAVDVTAPDDSGSGITVISTTTTTVPTFPPAAGTGTPSGGITVVSTTTTVSNDSASPT